MAEARVIPRITSTQECCFRNMVDRMMEMHRMQEHRTVHFLCRKSGRCTIAICAAMELNTWIVPCKSGGAQQVSVGVERAYDQKKRHAAVKEDNVSVKILPVAEEEPDEDGRDIGEPQKVRDHKIFAERDVIIQRKMNHVIRLIGASFQPDKPGDIDGKIENRPYMRIVF